MAYKAVVIGMGRHGPHHLQRLTRIDDLKYGTNVGDHIGEIAIVDIDERKLHDQGERFGIPEENRFNSMDDFWGSGYNPDFAIVTPSPSAHAECAERFLYERIPTLIEKPLSLSISNAERLAKISKERGTISACGYQMLQEPGFIAAAEFLEEGLEIKSLNIEWLKNRGFRTHPIGSIITEDTHSFGYVAKLLGESHSVAATGNYIVIYVDETAWNNEGIGTDDQDPDLHLFPLEGTTELNGKIYRMGEILGTTLVKPLYLNENNGRIPTEIKLSYEYPLNRREIQIVAQIPGELDTPKKQFGDIYHIHAGFTKIPYSGIQPFLRIVGGIDAPLGKDLATRRGMGQIVEEKIYGDTDPQGEQMRLFLESIESGTLSKELMTLDEAVSAERIANLAEKNIMSKKARL